ncbi:hypothetical protein [Lacrimispora sp.]
MLFTDTEKNTSNMAFLDEEATPCTCKITFSIQGIDVSFTVEDEL